MKGYFFTLIALIVLFVGLSLDEAQIAFAMITFGIGAIVALVVVNALALMLLAFPAIMAGRVAGAKVGWALFAVLVIALMFGPGVMRRQATAGLNDIPPAVTGVLNTQAQSVALRYPNGFVAHNWFDGLLEPKLDATPKDDIEILCDALCLGVLRHDTVKWVEIVRPGFDTYRLRLDRGSVVVDENGDDTAPDISISLEDRLFPENKTSALQIWSGLQRQAARKVVDHREADRVVLERGFWSYSGVDDLVFFFPTLSTNLGSGIVAPWNWPTRRFRSDPEDMPDLASELAAIGLPLTQGDETQIASGADLSLLKRHVDALISKPVIPGRNRIEPFPEEDRQVIYRFLTLLGKVEPDADLTDTAFALFFDPRNYDTNTVLKAMAATEQAVPFVVSILKTNQTSTAEQGHYSLFKALDDDQARAVWRMLDADIGLGPLFDGATDRQRVIYMKNLVHMEDREIMFLGKATGLAIETNETPATYSNETIGTNPVIRQAFYSAKKLPIQLHSQAIPLIVDWLDQNIAFAQAVQPNCHYLITDAIKALDKIGGYLEAEAFLKRHDVTCPKR